MVESQYYTDLASVSSIQAHRYNDYMWVHGIIYVNRVSTVTLLSL